jgi:hypothetical protein
MERKMQPAIAALLGLGPIPSSATATTATLRAFEEQLSKVQTPVTDKEACALVRAEWEPMHADLGFESIECIRLSPCITL